MNDRHKKTNPFSEQKAGKNGVDSDLGPLRIRQVLHQVQAGSLGDRVGHAAAAVGDSLHLISSSHARLVHTTISAYRYRGGNQVDAAFGICVEKRRSLLNQLQMGHDVDGPTLHKSVSCDVITMSSPAPDYLGPLVIIQGMKITELGQLGPPCIGNNDVDSAKALDSLLDETHIIFAFPGVLSSCCVSFFRKLIEKTHTPWIINVLQENSLSKDAATSSAASALE